jgi:regulator of sigma E protease
MLIFNLLLFILVLGTIILIHEFGHFYFARRAGILVHEFSIGMGPSLYSVRKEGVLYSIRAIPIGGYVSMAGESISDALIKKGQTIRLSYNESEFVSHIYLHDTETFDVEGTVVAYDLYGKSNAPLWIELMINNTVVHYEVLRDAVYQTSSKQYMYVTPAEKSFETKSLWARFLTIFAGPFMNFVLAFILYLLVGLFILQVNMDSNTIASVSNGLPASQLGIEANDKITKINNMTITSWEDLNQTLKSLETYQIDIEVLKTDGSVHYFEEVKLLSAIQTLGIANYTFIDGELSITDAPTIMQSFGRAQEAGLNEYDLIHTLTQGNYSVEVTSWQDVLDFFLDVTSGEVVIEYYENGSDLKTTTVSLIGASALEQLGYQPFSFQLGVLPTQSFNIIYSLTHPFRSISDNVNQVFQTLALLFNRNEDIGLSDLSGPVGIFSLVGQSASQGLLSILSFTAFLSINIGILNLLPIPALDGGRLVFLGFEAVFKKPLSRKLENSINMAMFYLLLALFVFVTYNDILRLIRGIF